MKSAKNLEVGLLLFYFAVGLVFRLWLSRLVPQPFINDQLDYDWFASKMLTNPFLLASHTFRTYPYPLFLALFYKVVGFGNHGAVFFLQAILDSVTGILVYLAIRFSFHSKTASRLGLLIFAVNPFTSGYVNVILSEVMATFFLTATLLFGVLFVRRPSFLVGLIFGLCAGITAEVRNAVFFWTLLPFGLAAFFAPPKKHKASYAGLCVGFALTLIYPLVTNWTGYRQVSITTVDNFFAKEFFNGAIIKELPPLAPPLPLSTYRMYEEYYSEYRPERDANYRRTIATKYMRKAWDIIRADPAAYIKTRFRKMWYVWQKEALYVYREPGFETHKLWTKVGNLILLISGFLGLVLWYPLLGKGKVSRFTWWTIVGTFVYGTLSLSFTHAEYRLTIPFYPFIIFCAALFYERILSLVRLQSSSSPATRS